MSGFSAEWLGLREPFDTAARAARIVQFLPAAPAERSIVDLGAGTGANLRYLAPLLGGTQDWLLVDDDRTLLAAAPAAIDQWAQTLDPDQRVRRGQTPGQTPGLTPGLTPGRWVVGGAGFSCRVRTREVNIARELDAVPIAHGALVTASALLDLVSAEWLHALAARCRAASASMLFALTYDGRVSTDPVDPDDQIVRELVNEHQHTDKGFGPALGPDAAAAAARAFALFGYEVESAASDWLIPPDARAMQIALIAGWHDAACAIAPKRAAALARWRRRRMLHVERGSSTLRVGHLDLAARLP